MLVFKKLTRENDRAVRLHLYCPELNGDGVVVGSSAMAGYVYIYFKDSDGNNVHEKVFASNTATRGCICGGDTSVIISTTKNSEEDIRKVIEGYKNDVSRMEEYIEKTLPLIKKENVVSRQNTDTIIENINSIPLSYQDALKDVRAKLHTDGTICVWLNHTGASAVLEHSWATLWNWHEDVALGERNFKFHGWVEDGEYRASIMGLKMVDGAVTVDFDEEYIVTVEE